MSLLLPLLLVVEIAPLVIVVVVGMYAVEAPETPVVVAGLCVVLEVALKAVVVVGPKHHGFSPLLLGSLSERLELGHAYLDRRVMVYVHVGASTMLTNVPYSSFSLHVTARIVSRIPP